MPFLITLLMLGLGVAAVWQLRRGSRPKACLCAGVVLVLAVAKLVAPGAPKGNELVVARLERHQQVLGTYVGKEVAKRYPGKRVLIVTPPEPQEQYEPPVASAWLTKYLERALAGGGRQVESMPLPIFKDPMLFDTKQLNALLMELKTRADVVVFTFDAPRRIRGRDLLPADSAPDLVIVGAKVENMPEAFASTVLEAVVVRRHPTQAWNVTESIPNKDETAFNNWYLWVTRDNASELAEQVSQIN